ncbi:MAG: UPF0175 family protein [Deltaproteobacteria bacterium]|nr:UPF0175 family protein [Deltaproteobacteria bacterium]MBW1736935.1 UPF0175 family protein [Deltaproteobacteria bacterium]MBW1910148.1 UPF0175 family protein [Deltaproteobacteria bacterium]MBW2034093.1 UPF0175 family protein [Deltaproteobacteria bacterium]MBW2114462.1 UPF0175 family protein [Deltaproteobacteria bacterium]
MEEILIKIPNELSKDLAVFEGNLVELLALGLRQVKIQQSLALFREGGISLWKAARLAGVSLREMTQYAVSQGLRATCDDQTLEEELS